MTSLACLLLAAAAPLIRRIDEEAGSGYMRYWEPGRVARRQSHQRITLKTVSPFKIFLADSSIVLFLKAISTRLLSIEQKPDLILRSRRRKQNYR